MNELIFFFNKAIVSGLIISSIYALGAIGITLIFGILRFAHFPHGDMMTLGAFVSLMLAALLSAMGVVLPFPLAFFMIIPAMAITAAAAIGIDRVFYAPLRARNAKPIVIVMASLGVALMIQGLIRLFAGVQSRDMYLEVPKGIYRFDVPGATRDIVVSQPQIVLILFTILAVVALHLFLTRSRLGKAMRAVSDNPDLARVSGINLNHVVWTTWIIAGSLAAAAGTLLSMDVFLKPDLAYNLLLPMFAATIVGGIGQPYGAVAGGFLVGFSETMAIFNWGVLFRALNKITPDWMDLPTRVAIVPTEYKLIVPFVILILVLIYRPTGIFKGKVL